MAFFVALLAGCSGAPPQTPPESDDADREDALLSLLAATECEPSFTGSRCFEPAVAVSPTGLAMAITGGGDRIVATRDRGATLFNVTPPPYPPGAPSGYREGDAMLHFDARGRLYFHSLFYEEGRAFGQVLGGLRVARSDDEGAAWKTNVFLSAATNVDPVPFLSFVDRQWFATGSGDDVYLTFWSVYVGGYVTQSRDAGATWSRFSPITLTPTRGGVISIPGPVVVAPDGSLAVPYFAAGESSAPGTATDVVVGVSADNGATWTKRIARSEGRPLDGGGWPILDIGRDGAWTVAWMNRQARLMTVSGRDGRAWGDPVPWSAPNAFAGPAPSLVSDGANLTLVWYSAERYGEPRSLLAARGPAAGPAPNATAWVTGLNGTLRLTDFAHHRLLPDGRMFTAWTDGRIGLFVGFEGPAG